MAEESRIARGADLPWQAGGNGARFVYQRKSLSGAAGGVGLGCSLFRLEPGKAGFPAHFHHANDEAIYVLSGQGVLRLGVSEHALGAGDYVALPPGGPDGHQMRNEGVEVLEYLCMSTMISPEVAEYPDSGKVAMLTGSAPGGSQAERKRFSIFRNASEVDYYDGEA